MLRRRGWARGRLKKGTKGNRVNNALLLKSQAARLKDDGETYNRDTRLMSLRLLPESLLSLIKFLLQVNFLIDVNSYFVSIERPSRRYFSIGKCSSLLECSRIDCEISRMNGKRKNPTKCWLFVCVAGNEAKLNFASVCFVETFKAEITYVDIPRECN